MFRVAAIQMESTVASVDENRQKAMRMVRQAASQGANVIALPELWVTGYFMNPEQFRLMAETASGETVQLFQGLAKELRTVLIVPFPERDEDMFQENVYISTAIIDADGTLKGIYRKSMLWGNEQGSFASGTLDYPVFETTVGTIGVLICYDIEFPEPARILALQNADVILVPSVWSKTAEHRWDIQLPARALDNNCYVLGVNTIGEQACGKSKLVDPYGNVLAEASGSEEEIIMGEVSEHVLQQVRHHIPYLKEYPLELTPGGMEKVRHFIRGA